MGIFGSESEQAVMDILREPAEGEGITPDGLPEGEANDMTEAEAAPEAEAEVEAEAAPEADAAPEAQETEAPAEQEAPAEAETVDMDRYKAAVREMNAKQREAAENSKRVAELEAELQKMKDSALQLSFNKAMTEEERAAFYQGLKDNPGQTMLELVSPMVTSMMDSRLQEERRRFDEAQREQESNRVFAEAYDAMTAEWPQLKDVENSTKVVTRMIELAENATRFDAGGPNPGAWKAAPAMYLRQAAYDLYGQPVKVDQNAIEAAKKRGYEEGLAQRQQREADKAKATPAAGSPPDNEPPETEEDRIKREILAQRSGRVF